MSTRSLPYFKSNLLDYCETVRHHGDSLPAQRRDRGREIISSQSKFTNNCESSRAIFAGQVQIICSQNDHKSKYLEAFCGDSEDGPARLIISEVTTSNDKVVMQDILFTDVKHVNCTDDRIRKIVELQTLEDGNYFKFYDDSETDTMKWFRYCGLLSAIPFCTIPKVPKENFVLQSSIDKYTNPERFNATCIWVVHILHEGIVKDDTSLTGLCVITIRNSDSTFNIYDYHNRRQLISWDRGEIIQCGGVESLVFLEVGRQCSGGSGLLWMQHPIPQAMTLRQCLQKFIYFGPESVSQPKPPVYSLPFHNVESESATSRVLLTSSSSCESFHLNEYVNQHRHLPTSYSTTVHPCNFATSKHQHAVKRYTPVLLQNSINSLCSSGYVSDANSLCDTLSNDFHTSITSTLTSNPRVSCESLDSFIKDKISHSNNNTTSTMDRMPNDALTPSFQLTHQSYDLHFENCSIHNSSVSSVERISELNPLQLKGITRTPSYDSCCLNGEQFSNSNRPSAMSSQQYCSEHSQVSCESISLTMRSMNRLSHSDVEDSTSPLPSIEVTALQKCSPVIMQKLNLPAILPHLIAQQMVTQREIEMMTNPSTPDVDKTAHLISMLPSKGDGFFGKFVLCLCQSKLATAHNDIVKSLTVTLNEVKSGTLRAAKKVPLNH